MFKETLFTMPDDSSRSLAPGECDQLLQDIARRADAVLRAAHDLALDHADAMLDACGIRRSLSGFNTLCRALALYLDVDVRSVCRRSYKSVVRALARETRASEAWTNHQMFYALRDAQKSGRFAAFADILRDRLGRTIAPDERNRLTVHEFLTYLRTLFCLEAYRRTAGDHSDSRP